MSDWDRAKWDRAKKALLVREAKALIEGSRHRGMTADKKQQFDALLVDIGTITKRQNRRARAWAEQDLRKARAARKPQVRPVPVARPRTAPFWS